MTRNSKRLHLLTNCSGRHTRTGQRLRPFALLKWWSNLGMTFLQYRVFGQTRTQTIRPDMATEIAMQHVRGFGHALDWICIVESASDAREPKTREECELVMNKIVASGGQSGCIGWPCGADGSYLIRRQC